jgi:RimJ/RimL family protein N-acetyltransferase
MRLVVDEWQKPIVEIFLRADETAALERLAAIGARECKRFRSLYAVDGRRVDGVMIEYLNAHWVDRLGDPADVELPRSGTGEPRPVTPPARLEGDPPANAVRVGPRVYLLPPQESDARTGAHWSTREDDTNWDNGRYPGSSTGWWKWMGKLQEETPPEWVRLAVCLRENDEMIGLVGIAEIDYRHRFAESESEIINPAYRGAGYGSEAKHLLFDYAFNTLGLHTLISWVFYRNTRSAAALRKQGYRDAGRTSWVTQREGTFVNMCNFELLADEWRAMPRRDPGATE